MLRTTLLCATVALAGTAAASNTPSCDALERVNGDTSVRLDAANIDLEGEDLRVRADGVELVHIDKERNLFIAGRQVAVPKEARPELDAFVAGFRALREDAKRVGVAGGKIAASAVTGLVDVLFTSTTMEDYEKRMEAKGAAIEAQADKLCRTVAELRRTEQALQQRIPAFPNIITRPITAL